MTRSRAILREEHPPAAVLHCFSSGRALAEAAIELGYYISISGIVTFRKAEDLRAIVRDLPLDRLLVETDAPYLAPVPYRGKRNEPAFVAATAAAVAALKGVEPERLASITSKNFFRLFSKATPPRRRHESHACSAAAPPGACRRSGRIGGAATRPTRATGAAAARC